MGVPECTVRMPPPARVEAKLTQSVRANFTASRLANPGVESLSCMSAGTRHSQAATTTGSDTKPPLEKTTAGRRLPINTTLCNSPVSVRNTSVTLRHTTTSSDAACPREWR